MRDSLNNVSHTGETPSQKVCKNLTASSLNYMKTLKMAIPNYMKTSPEICRAQ